MMPIAIASMREPAMPIGSRKVILRVRRVRTRISRHSGGPELDSSVVGGESMAVWEGFSFSVETVVVSRERMVDSRSRQEAAREAIRVLEASSPSGVR